MERGHAIRRWLTVVSLAALFAAIFLARLIGASPALLLEFRLPQAIAAALAGAALAVSGLQMQTVFQNPLAGPWVLGLVAGAQLGVTILIVSGAAFGLHFSGVLSPVSLSGITIAAGLGSLLALLAALALARHVGSAALLVCGLLFGAVIDGIRGFLIHLVNVKYELLFLSWNQAGFGGVTWSQLTVFGVAVAAGIALAMLLSKSLNGLLLGATYGRSLGISLTVTRRLSMLSTVLLGGSATAFCGAVLFIDLAVPHLCRGLLRTADHRRLVPAAALVGASMALFADAGASLAPGGEVLPVNIMTCLLGGPVVVGVLLRGERGVARAS
jgi:iron complex transport system permease protein